MPIIGKKPKSGVQSKELWGQTKQLWGQTNLTEYFVKINAET